MRARRVFSAVDSHTEGMPTRVITGGLQPLPGATMLDRKQFFEAELDHLRLLLMREPRGHGAMSGAFLQPPTRPDADWGVLFIEVSGLLPMCGHGTIGVATVLVETGMVEVTEPQTRIRLDTPAGLVEARVDVHEGRAVGVTIRNVPSFLLAREREVEVPGIGRVTYDMAFGGNFYAILPAASVGLAAEPSAAARLIESGLAIMTAIEAAERPVHPLDERLAGCRHVVFHQPGRDGADARAATAIHPGWLDRSPCGTGTSARLAQLHARGEVDPGRSFVNESVLGTRFTGRIVATTDVGGRPAIVPEISGRAWVTGMGHYLLDPDDPFPAGFALG
jgi:proline racemase